LLIGTLAFGVGWIVGLVLLWSSPTWRLREKLLGTLLIPGGLPYGVIIAYFGLPLVSWSPPILGFAALAILLLGPVYTSIHLTWRLIHVLRTRSASIRINMTRSPGAGRIPGAQ
jgi:hypothetical protein